MTASDLPEQADPLGYAFEPLHQVRHWMKFLAVLMFIGGGIQALTVVGLVVAWIPVLIGVFLWQAATALADGHPAGDVARLRRAAERIRHLFITYAVLAIVALAGLGFLLALGLLAAIAEAL